MNKIFSIQILRGIAALSVMALHFLDVITPVGENNSTPLALFGWGSIGVDLFFVISGFIMVCATSGKDAGIKTSLRFLIGRMARVFPTYYIILLFAFVTGGAMSIFHYPGKIDNLISAITMQPYILDPAPKYVDTEILSVRWTLNYELYFYLAFAVCLAFKRKIIPLAVWFVSPVLIAYFLTGGFTLSTSGYHFDTVHARFLTNPILFEFGAGVLAGYAYLALREKFAVKSLAPSILCFAAIALGIASGLLGGSNLLSAGAFFFLVLLFALQSDAIVKRAPACLIRLGDISFSLYLIHLPLFNGLVKHLKEIAPEHAHGWIVFIVMISLSIFAANLSHDYLEVRFTNKIKRMLSGSVPRKITA